MLNRRFVLIFLFLLAPLWPAMAASWECKLAHRHTCYVAKCDTISWPMQAYFELDKRDFKLCGEANGKDECKSYRAVYQEQPPFLRTAVIEKDDGQHIFMSFDLLSTEKKIWVVIPLAGGIGIVTGPCTERKP